LFNSLSEVIPHHSLLKPTQSSHNALQWDPAGEQLAIIPVGNSFVFLWNALTKEVSKIDSEFKVGFWEGCLERALECVGAADRRKAGGHVRKCLHVQLISSIDMAFNASIPA
jgi:hypothetical protein